MQRPQKKKGNVFDAVIIVVHFFHLSRRVRPITLQCSCCSCLWRTFRFEIRKSGWKWFRDAISAVEIDVSLPSSFNQRPRLYFWPLRKPRLNAVSRSACIPSGRLQVNIIINPRFVFYCFVSFRPDFGCGTIVSDMAGQLTHKFSNSLGATGKHICRFEKLKHWWGVSIDWNWRRLWLVSAEQ